MTENNPAEQMIGAQAIEHIGREGLLEDITAYVLPENNQSRLAFVQARGGMGKTRLLQKLRDTLSSREDVYTTNTLIDLYHIPHHTASGLYDTLATELESPAGTFREYWAIRRRLEQLRIALDAGDLAELQKELLGVFEEVVKELAQQKRVILMLDTGERLHYNPLNQQEEASIAEVWSRLHNLRDEVDNLSIIVAGRPEMRPLYSEELSESTDPLAAERLLKLPKFTQGECNAYLDSVIARAHELEQFDLAKRLSGLMKEQRAALFQYSQGRPVVLALTIDLVSLDAGWPFGDGGPEPISNSTDDESESGIPDEFGEWVVERLQTHTGITGETIILLGRLSKGADAPLLARVLMANDGDNVHFNVDVAQKRLDLVRHLSFVKVRPSDERVFLHDEMYDLLRKAIYNTPWDQGTRDKCLSAVLGYQEEGLDRVRQRIGDIWHPVEMEGEAQFRFDLLQNAVMERRVLLVETLYYRLHHAPTRGFLRYYRYMREAINAGDTLLDKELVLTLQEFWRERDPQNILDDIEELERSHVTAVIRVRSVAQAFAERQFGETVRLAKRFHEDFDEKYTEDTMRLSRAGVAIYWAYALIYQGKNENLDHAEILLSDILKRLDAVRIERGDSPDYYDPDLATSDYVYHWRIEAIQALTLRTRAYLYFVQGRLHASSDDYQCSIERWRRLKVDVELSVGLNDYGYVLALLGKRDDAIDVVNEALSLRRRVGQRGRIGLSYNTLALVYLMDDNYHLARRYAERALALSRAIEAKRGTGLALVALAQIYRRSAQSDQFSTAEEREGSLHHAVEATWEGTEIFTEENEPNRYLQLLITRGNAQRDRAILSQSTAAMRVDTRRLVRQAQESYATALHTANNQESVVALINISVAQLEMGYRLDDWTSVHTSIQLVGDKTPATYQFSDTPPNIPQKRRMVSSNAEEYGDRDAMWNHLARYWSFRGHLEVKRYIDSRPHWERMGPGEELDEAARCYMLAIEYGHYFATDHPVLRTMTTEIHIEKIGTLTSLEQRELVSGIIKAEKRYGLEGISRLRETLQARLLWV